MVCAENTVSEAFFHRLEKVIFCSVRALLDGCRNVRDHFDGRDHFHGRDLRNGRGDGNVPVFHYLLHAQDRAR